MSPFAYIRIEVFCLSQKKFAAMIGVNQGTVSRWDNGTNHPDYAGLQIIREQAKAQGLAWNDSWFFEAPESNPHQR